MTNLQQELTAAQQRLQQAREAERQRIERENSGKRAIEEAEDELRAAQGQLHQQALNTALAQNHDAIEQVLKLHRDLIAALEAGDARGAILVAQQDAAAWQAHRQALRAALEMVVTGYFANDQVFAFAERHQFRQIWPFAYELLAWIGQSPDDVTRRIRQAMSLVVIGNPAEIIDAERTYRADAAYQADQRNKRHSMF